MAKRTGKYRIEGEKIRDYVQNKVKAEDVIFFIESLKLVDEFYGQPFVLLDWQKEFIYHVYGTMKPNNLRKYKYAYLEIPKKNGKTTIIAALALYHLYNDAPGGQIYCCAAEREQAGLVYKAACGMRAQDKTLSKDLKLTESKKEIKNIATGTVLKVLSSEAYSKHGINPSVVIFDELHAQPNRELWDVMTFGSGDARKEPLYWVITTAGDDPDRHSIGWEIHDKAQRIINGELDIPSWYCKIYSCPETADIFDEKQWHLCNPSLGHTINIDDFREAAEGAKVSQAAEKLFRWLKLNQWVSLKRTSWLPLNLWDETESDYDKENLIGKRCYAGLDLSSTTDLTALCLLFPPQIGVEKWTAIFDAWLPIENMKERVARDHVPYDTWYKNKYLTCTPGNVIDYEFIQARLKQLSIQYEIEIIGYDPYNATQLMINLENDEHEVAEVAQTIKVTSPAMKEIERLMRSGQYTHEKNPIARWCFGNLVVFVDGNENMKPMKNRSHERIDLIMALIDAMAVAMKFEDMENTCPYTAERGILII